MAYQLQEINGRIREDVRGFLEECDGEYGLKVARAADHLIRNMKKSPVVLLSGPSGSGKTTTAQKVEEELRRRGVNSHTISMDNYFKTLTTAPLPVQRRAISTTNPPNFWIWISWTPISPLWPRARRS